MMTGRENLLTALKGGQPEWVPVVGHCDPYNQPNKRGMEANLAAKLAEVKWHDESTVIFSRALGLDIADWFSPPVRRKLRKVELEEKREGDAKTWTWKTPLGEMRRVQRYSASTNLWHTEEHEVKGKEDLAKLAELFADIECEYAPDAVETVRKRRELIGEDGIIMFPVDGTPMGQMVRAHAGVETLAYLWADAREELGELFRVMEASHRKWFELAVELDGDAIVSVDDTSTTTISPRMFEEFSLGYTDRMAEITHAGGKFYFHHSCGLIKDLLALYRRTKMDAVHAFTIPPIGNVGIAEGRRLLGPDITIFAGLTQLFGDMSDRKAVGRSIEQMFEEAGSGRRFILGLAADPEKTMEETRFVADECRKHQ